MNRFHPLNIKLVLLLFSVLMSSCELLKKDPEFIGTWQHIEKITADNLVYNNTRTITLTKNSYEETYTIQRENSNSVIAIIGTRGNLVLSRSILTFSLEEIGTCVPDESGNCTGSAQWYGEGTQYWNDNMQYFEKTVSGEFEVSGNTLHLMRDMNNDGDLEDAGEDVTFEMI